MLNHKKTFPSALLTFLSGAGIVGFIIFDIASRWVVNPRALALFFRAFGKLDFGTDVLWMGAILGLIVTLFWLPRQFASHENFHLYARALTVFLVAWILYLVSAYLIALRWDTPPKAYFPELAAAFLKGRTYIDPIGPTSDLTFHQGHWYVAFPPLASLLMLPQVTWAGSDAVNSVKFSVVYGALNVALVYLIIEALRKRLWIRLPAQGSLWLAALFGFGTVHWYLTLSGNVWQISQILTVTFSALAVYLMVETGSLFVASMALGIAMLARPNVVFLWSFLFGIHISIKGIVKTNFLRTIFRPAMLSLIPIGLIVLGLMGYNLIRFDDPFEFGYRAMNVGVFLKGDLATYGQFHPHFLIRNLNAMFLSLPHWDPSCGFFVPDPIGMSIFITTPALILLYRVRLNSIWTRAAWISVILLLAPLMLYYNTGSAQFGYRFLMDMSVPLFCLLALAFGERVSITARFLVWAGILVNYLGLLWFYAGICQ